MSLVVNHISSLGQEILGFKHNFFQKTLDFVFGICYNCDNMKEKMKTAEEENQENTKPCRVDGKTPCVQYPEEECDCDPCDDCEIAIIYKRMKE